jgi:hypothetical protein
LKHIYQTAKEKAYFFLNKTNSNEYFSFVAVFLFFLVLNTLIYFTVSNVSSGDDQWFYFKMAYLLRTEGWGAIVHFKGAYFTELVQGGYAYAFGLYHYFLIPFTFFSNKIVGLKLSGLFFASLVPALTYSTLRKFDFKNSLVWVTTFFYALASVNFTFRLFLNRPFVLDGALLMLEIYLINKKKYWAIFFVSLINTWWHPATFWLPLVLVSCFEVIRLMHKRKLDLRLIGASIAGSLGGFMFFPPHSHTFLSPLNPFYFIKTLFSFVYGLGSGPKIIEGAENYKGDIFGLLGQSEILLILLVFYIVFSVIIYLNRRNNGEDLDGREDRIILRESVFFITSIVFLGFVFSKRFEDLLVPIVLLASLIAFQMLWDSGYLKVESMVVKKIIRYSFLVLLAIFVSNRILDIRNTIGSDKKFLNYEKVGNWLKNNTQQGEIVFNTDFGQFNRLFFYDSWNNYIVGLEPKNLYEYDQEYYWLWHNITLNGAASDKANYAEEAKGIFDGKGEEDAKTIMLKNAHDIALTVKNIFKSEYIFFDQDTFLRRELDKDSDEYELAYQDKAGGIFVYKVKLK